jgi:hypothetical protein
MTAKDSSSGTTLVIKATPPDGKAQLLAYDVSTPSSRIVQDSSSCANILFEPEYIETFTETVERSKWLGSGFSFRLGSKKWGFFEVEKKPTKEVRKIKKVIWRSKPEEE